MQTLIGIFPTKDEANAAVNDLKEFGYDHSDISVIMKNDVHISDKGSKGGMSYGGILTGAASGGILGGLAGLLIGIGAIAIPGIGPLLVAGPLATALGLTGAAAGTVTGAATGIVAGGIVGGLVDLGLPKQTAIEYEQRLKQGGVLLAVPVASESDTHRVRRLFELHNADYINSVVRT